MVHGKLRLVVGNSETVMGQDDIVIIPPDTPHEAEALEDTIVIDVFSPLRDDFLTGGRPNYLR
jgi:quercetin dioxygenase-like cupin family protein